jgi:uncharacterized protein YycO
MKIIFCNKPSLASWLIRLACWSKWSHCAIIDDDIVLESTFKRGGVGARLFSDFIQEYSQFEITDVPCPNDELGIEWAKTQIGKKYDWSAIFGFITRQPLADESNWFCSEYVEGAIKAAGNNRFRAELNRITPQHVWMVN